MATPAEEKWNFICTALLSHRIPPLEELVLQVRDVELKHVGEQSVLKMRLEAGWSWGMDKTTVLMFPTGKLLAVGASSAETSRAAMEEVVRRLNEARYAGVSITRFKVDKICLGSALLPPLENLYAMALDCRTAGCFLFVEMSEAIPRHRGPQEDPEAETAVRIGLFSSDTPSSKEKPQALVWSDGWVQVAGYTSREETQRAAARIVQVYREQYSLCA